MLADRLFRHESARLRAGLVRQIGPGHLDVVDDIIQETLLAALRKWRFTGVPENPAAWLMRVAQRKAVDAARIARRQASLQSRLLTWATLRADEPQPPVRDDDPIRLMLLCAHPQLTEQDRIMLTLSLAAGFGVSEIARAFILSPAAAEQRLVRAKRSLREPGTSMELEEADLSPRCASVLETLYLMLNEGYSTHAPDPATRRELIAETRYLLGLLRTSSLVPANVQADVHALSALACFVWARISTRLDADGGLILLEDQNRSQWDRSAIGEGLWHLARSSGGEQLTAYGVEAGIAGCHATAPTFSQTDWGQIVRLYELLVKMKPTPVVQLNAAAALAMHRGAQAGLDALDAMPVSTLADRYHLVEATRGEILRRVGRTKEASLAFERAMLRPCSEAEQEFLRKRLAQMHD